MLPRPLMARACRPAAVGSVLSVTRASAPRASVRCCSSAPSPQQPSKPRALRGLTIAGNVTVHINTLNLHLAAPPVPAPPAAVEAATTQADANPPAADATDTSKQLQEPQAPASALPSAANTPAIAGATESAEPPLATAAATTLALERSANPTPISSLSSPAMTAPYACCAVLEPPPRLAASQITLGASGSVVAAYHEHDGYTSGEYCGDAYCLLWDPAQPVPSDKLDNCCSTSFAIAASGDGRRLFMANILGAEVWDAATEQCRDLELRLRKRDGRTGAEGSEKGQQAKEDIVGGEDATEEEDDDWWDSDFRLDIWMSVAAISADGKYAAACSNFHAYKPGSLKVWDLDAASRQPIVSVELMKDEERAQLVSLAFSGDGGCSLTAIDDRGRVWAAWPWQDAVGLRQPVTLEGAGKFDRASIAADGRTAVARKGANVQVWDLASATLTATLEGHAKDISCVCISADGRLAVSGGEDRAVRVWDLQSGSCVYTLTGHTTHVTQVAISADGSCVVSAGGSGVLRVWQRV